MSPYEKATPRPWEQRDDAPAVVSGEYGYPVLFPASAFRPKAEIEANAALVVRAVNSFDAHRKLLEAPASEIAEVMKLAAYGRGIALEVKIKPQQATITGLRNAE